jgi:NADPH:quinone reductase-like Zn-dependent oxidoreductase
MGVDQVLEVVGGDGLNQSIAATKVGGHIAQIGFLAGQKANINLMPLLFRQVAIRGIAVGPTRSFERMNAFLNEHRIRPVIDRVYPFSQAIQAYDHLARGAFGKVVIKVSD